MPPAPLLLSITMGWPSLSAMAAATGRAKPSEPPPAGYGTTQVTVLSGQSAARALPRPPP